MKRFTADMRLSAYEKLNAIAGPESLSYTMERLIDRYYGKLVKRQSAQIEETTVK